MGFQQGEPHDRRIRHTGGAYPELDNRAVHKSVENRACTAICRGTDGPQFLPPSPRVGFDR